MKAQTCSKMPLRPFDNLKIALAGSFGANWTKERMKKFIQNNGGEVVDYKESGLTHVICTVKAFDERAFAGQYTSSLLLHDLSH